MLYSISRFFFFSSRRRHTRLQGDWSSDVCSSDLLQVHQLAEGLVYGDKRSFGVGQTHAIHGVFPNRVEEHFALVQRRFGSDTVRSEERRVGKEGRSRWSPYH